MGLAGMGAGAAASLEDIVAQRILQQKLEQEIADRQQRFSLDQQRFDETAQNNAFDRKRTERLDTEAATARTAKADQEATARRGRSNMAGVIGMGLDPATAKREIAVSALNANTSVPDGVMEAIEPPPAPKKYSVRTVDAKGRPINKLATEEEMQAGVPEYREPKEGPRTGVHVVGGSLVDDNGKVLFTDPNKTPKDAPTPYANERAARTIQSVDELMGQVGRSNTGYGSLLAGVPESSARNFKGQLDTLKANIAFNELSQMREASKTGGALGAVSEREMQLLQSALGALDQGQSPENIKAQLAKVKESVQRWQQAVGGSSPSMTPVGSHGPTTADPRVDALLKKYGGG